IFKKSVESRPEDNLYVFYDGPPFISGLPHYGHILSSIAKDVIPRYWTMKGKRVERVWGWDAHGLTVENSVQRKLGIKKRRDIEEYGLEKFIQECYKYTSETSEEWVWYIDKIARWVDMENAYKTIDRDYMESVIWAFKQLYEKEFIYQGVYTSLFCTTCGTPVSNFEIAMDNSYKEVEDPSITVKFRVITKGDYYGDFILAWTTTPWTIPSNRGLVVDPNETYAKVEHEEEVFIAAEKRIEQVFDGKEHKVLKTFLGKELLGLEYVSPYTFYKKGEHDFKVYEFEGMVTMDEGTGIVHSAPGFGEVDTKMGYHYGVSIMLSLDDEGKFTAGTDGKNPYEGVFYADANEDINKDLEERNLMFRNERATHRFPYHDRCSTLLIQKAQNSWFVNIQKLKADMVKNNEEINWVPDHLKDGRFKNVLENSPDWCISRSRFWATPMPVWKSDDGDLIVLGSIAEIEEMSGQKIEDLHRPYIDEITIEKDGKIYKRIPEVLDSWFEAGSMSYAQFHYPFENQEKFEKNFPGDYIIEYIAQVRAWFNMMHRLSTALFGSHSFKNVITTGVIAGDDGRKMSKSFQNYTDPKEVLETIGGDATRLYFMNSPLMLGENANFDLQELKNKSRNVLNPLWNSLKFFLIYANFHKWEPKKRGKTPKSENILDKWIIGRLHEVIRDFTVNIEKYLIPQALQPFEDFVDDLSRWYVRRSRSRISGNEKEALDVFHYVLSTFSKACAPAIPFMAEEIYQSLRDKDSKIESVHLEEYPGYDQSLIDANEEIIVKMKKTRDLVSASLSIRVENKIPVRQPLRALTVYEKEGAKDGGVLEEDYLVLIREEVNVKEVVFNK
ncbi:isoleucine--tRNA ligase, partial [Patescibacteria group bacterium]